MGWYIQGPSKGKARYLAELGAVKIEEPATFSEVPSDRALICIVDNGPFDAAVLIPYPREFNDFKSMRGDDRPMVWMTMDKGKAYNLAGFKP